MGFARWHEWSLRVAGLLSLMEGYIMGNGNGNGWER
jgi:hypothetical protein